MDEHSVREHLRVDADDYDTAIRKFVPHYDEMLSTAVALLDALVVSSSAGGPRLLELGGGTGAFTEAILRGLPRARVELLDVDPAMLAQARARLAPLADRLTVHQASFHDPLPRCDAVVASLALHHVRDLEAKTRLYRAIFESLPPGGLFLNVDATVSGDPRFAALTMARWAASMGEHGIDEAAARKHLADWAEEDRYFSLYEELNALVSAGFRAPECFWRRGSQTIYGGRKDDR